MTDCPAYRLRLFLSADLAGSTAYKSGPGAEQVLGGTQPKWVHSIRHFYRDFPDALARNYTSRLEASGASDARHDHPPKMWKLAGDEIVFCCRVVSHEHICQAVSAFIDTLHQYGAILLAEKDHLDIKGAAWLAAFPAPNVTVPLNRDAPTPEQESEEQEIEADLQPRTVDFLGPSIDEGFRVAKYAATDHLALSIVLAYLLAEGAARSLFSGEFHYHNRAALKGVLKDRPYPIVTVNTERSHAKKSLAAYESALTKTKPVNTFDLSRYLMAFMRDAGVEPPFLPDGEVDDTKVEPESYRSYVAAWNATKQVLVQKAEVERQSADESPADEIADPESEDRFQRILDQLPSGDPTAP